MFIGILLLLLGLLMLLDRLNIIQGGIGQFLPPIAIIALGIHFLAGTFRRPAK